MFISIGEHSVNYQVSEMKFKNYDGNKIVLKGMNTYPNQVVSSHSMRSILIYEDIEWAVECFTTTQG